MSLNLNKQLPIVQALAWIVCTTLLITGSAFQGLKAYLKWQHSKAFDPKFNIVSIIQTGPEKEALNTAYLAEMMGISCDEPQSIYYFNTKKAEERLLQSPVIKEAHVKVIKPGTVYIDYTVRHPLAWLLDYENVAFDEEGFFFPVSPFFSPKNLPGVYFGLPSFGQTSEQKKLTWNSPLEGKYISLALEILTIVTSASYRDVLNVRRIDISQAFAESYGQREIVLSLEDHIIVREGSREVIFSCPRLLRLSTKNFAQELGNYLGLRKQLLEQEKKKCQMPQDGKTHVQLPLKILDFRIPNLAFIKEQEDTLLLNQFKDL